MKLLFTFLVLALFLFPKNVSAHIAGQPPFFLMNEKYAEYYPVYTTSVKGFTLPQDIAPEKYLINQPVSFEIDREMLPFPPEITGTIIFTWDFGDGTTGTGFSNNHTYTKPGSYFLKITADYGGYEDEFTKPIIQDMLLHVLPNANYQLPQAVISINGKTSSDPLTDIFSFKPKTRLTFDAAKSITGDAKITSYKWDTGTGEERKEKSFTLSYSPDDIVYVFPMLRITTDDNFISDTYVQIENVQDSTTPQNSSFPIITLLIGVNVIVMGTGAYFLLRKPKKKSS